MLLSEGTLNRGNRKCKSLSSRSSKKFVRTEKELIKESDSR